ncbi:MAG: NarK/NasA family nitrate transporter [Gammaproteobacteria bacterium]|nr:NarK/NasA family nitrate transporter [Gammaproteobacteria bacterium]
MPINGPPVQRLEAVSAESVMPTEGQRRRALAICTIAFGTCFAVWVIYSIIGIEIQRQLHLSETAFGLLVATPILTGSLSRPLLGVWSERFGARRVMIILMLLVTACAFALSRISSFPALLAIGLGLGLAGGAFAVGVVYVSSWYPKERAGTALGLFGIGNAGASVTSFFAPFLIAAIGWRQAADAYGLLLLVMCGAFYLLAPEDPATRARRGAGRPAVPLSEQFAPLRNLQVWRFSTYYFLMFGGFVALTSWLPRYYMGAHGLDIRVAGMLTAAFALPATVFRALGGILADRRGARLIMYIAFSVSLLCLFLLSYPNTHYVVDGINGPIHFTIAPSVMQRAIVLGVLGFVLSLGAAAVFKHVPSYYPKHVGAVSGLVGMIGGLGGFFMPILFGMMNDLLGIWTSCFMLLFAVAAVGLIWMHASIRSMERRHFPEIRTETDLPEIMDAAAARPRGADPRH